jgi:methionine aminotransferase
LFHYSNKTSALVKKKKIKRAINPETEIILITAGATQGILLLFKPLLESQDEVIIVDPSCDCYEAPILLCNATLFAYH